MQVLPRALTHAIEIFERLPGVGPRTAERYAYHLLKSDPAEARKLADAVSRLHDGIGYCQKTFALVE
jgi:recombination protein RecR